MKYTDKQILEWLLSKAHVQDRDGGMNSSYCLPHFPRHDCWYKKPFHYDSIKESIIAEMKKEEV